ncbi:MAG TPA: cobalamin-dependent protein [Thermoanaerobaculia bacterium]|nr:cobalamin-dependent protein [Thermoanaerobaculia bacterium]
MIAAHTIRTRIEELATAVADRHFAAFPQTLARYGDIGRVRCLEDARFHLRYLATALDAHSEEMFLDYVAWTRIVLARRNVPQEDLAENLRILATTLNDILGAPNSIEAVQTLHLAIEKIPSMAGDVPSFLDPRAPFWTVASAYLAALLRGNRHEAMEDISRALEEGAKLRDIYRSVFEPVQQEIGRLWQLNQISVAQEHYCTAATQQIMTQLYGRIFGGEKKEKRAVSMCVGGELHEIGLRIVTDLLELEGWQTWYLGANTPPAAAAQLCVDQHADALLISATLPPHLPEVADVVRQVRARRELEKMKILVGGRAFRNAPDLWRTIGADAYAADADECLATVAQF